MRRRVEHRPRPEWLEPRQLLAAAAEFWVGFRAGLSPAAERRALNRVGAYPVETLPGGLTRVALSPEADWTLDAAIARLARASGVRYAERDRTLTVEAFPVNDPDFAGQWGLNQTNNVDIDAPEAWSLVGGGLRTIVAVLDSGISVSHPDLASRLWVNPGEIPGNGIDDDGNGYVDDIHGWNFSANTSNLTDEIGHGTHVAGIVAAQANNGRGVVGVNPGAILMPLKFIDGTGSGDTSDAIRAIYYAVKHGVRVINASWGGGSNSRPLAEAIRYAGNRGVVFVTAAGNEGRNLDVYRSYPASFRLPTMLAVAAIESSGRLAGFSNRGQQTVAIAAPGVGIRSTLGRDGYGLMSGTSMATPFVAGVASLVIAANPQLSAAQVVQRIIASAKPLPGLQAKVAAGGMVDADNALNPPPTPARRPAPAPRRATPRPATTSRAQLGAGDLARADLFGSGEYYLVHGGTNEGFVRGLYTDVLGRPPASFELAAGVMRLQRGAARAVVARGVLSSEEAARTKVAFWYLNDLASSTSLQGLKSYRPVITLARRLRSGVRESRVHAELLGTTALTRAAGGNWTRMAELLYQAAMARPASPDEAANLAGRLAAGLSARDAALQMLGTEEARRTRVARWLQSDLLRDASLDVLKLDPVAFQIALRLTD